MEGNLKKITLVIATDELGKIGLNYLEALEGGGQSIEITDGLKISSETCVNIWQVQKETTINRKRLGITELSKVKTRDGKTTYLVKKRPTKLTLLLEKHNIYYEFPLQIDCESANVSITGLSKEISKFLSALESLGVRFRVTLAADYITQTDILSTLTNRQKEALLIALREGYFKTPRETNAHILAEILGIKHTTFLQHLRRAQEKILKKVADNAP
jgi:predicted DNA binding protein